jgi:hypothetical protein
VLLVLGLLPTNFTGSGGRALSLGSLTEEFWDLETSVPEERKITPAILYCVKQREPTTSLVVENTGELQHTETLMTALQLLIFFFMH